MIGSARVAHGAQRQLCAVQPLQPKLGPGGIACLGLERHLPKIDLVFIYIIYIYLISYTFYISFIIFVCFFLISILRRATGSNH